MTIAVYARSLKANNPSYIEQIYHFLKEEGVDLIIHEPYYQSLKSNSDFKLELNTFSTSEQLIAKAFFVISLGGDGTLLETVAFVKKSGIPILGVNTGRLGFLASVNKNDLQKALKQLLNEKFSLDKRELIEMTGCAVDTFNGVNYALNEFTIHKIDRGAMINIDTYIDGVFLNSYFADGLIVSTPTGSTAYSLSCGGPIMMPDSDNFIITPIAPHNLSVRPIIISNNKEISFKIKGRSDSCIISLDSRNAQIAADSEIKIKKANFRVNLINLEGQHFFATLRNKMMWGIDQRH
ncbi:MAG TPA: NAD kinase [Bacteroidia bacterium]|nr:NAD kinase [Bacteroidia bacterium]